MADFPELIPARRAYSLGLAPVTQRSWLDALEVAHQFGSQATAHALQLEFDEATSDAEWLQIRNHWAGQQGSVLPFAVPAAVWAGHDDYGQVVAGLQWRYASPPRRPDLDAGLGPGTVELVAERLSQPLLSAGAAPWFGAAVPLVAVGVDPGPPPPAVPAGVPTYVPIDAPGLTPGVTGQATGEGMPTHASQHGGSYQAATGSFLSLPLGREQVDETPANSGVAGPSGSKSVEPGDPLTYRPACSDPGTPKWFYQPDVKSCDTAGKTSAQLLDEIRGDYGIEPPSGTSIADLRKLLCKAVEASGYGLYTFKNDTVARLSERISAAKSKGRTPGQPISLDDYSMPVTVGSPQMTPMLIGSGRMFVRDNCGETSQGSVEYSSTRWKRPVLQVAAVGYGLDTPVGGVGPVIDGKQWAGIGGVQPTSAYGFFIKDRNLYTFDDDGNEMLLGGSGFVDAFKIQETVDSNGLNSGVYSIQNGQWVYTPPQS